MTDSTRPAGFKLPSASPRKLFLYFGHGDYVIAPNAPAASVIWMDHFDDIAYAKDFEMIPDLEQIEIWVMKSTLEVADREAMVGNRCVTLQMNAAWWVKRFGAGYLASTTED